MKVTPQEWDRTEAVFSKLSHEQRNSFSGVRPREIRWLVAPEESIRPQYKKRISESRERLEKIFQDHQLQGAVCRELLARLLVLGQTQVFRKLRSVEPVEVIDEHFKYNPSYASPIQTKLEGMAAEILDDSLTDLDLSPDELIPLSQRYGISGAEFHSLFIQGILREAFRHYEPFKSQEKKLLSPEQKQWQFFESSVGVGAKADKKETGQKRICEDDILFIEGSSFQLGAVFDGLGCCDNFMNVLWQQILKNEISRCFGKIKEKKHESDLKKHLEKSIKSAQKKMKKIFAELLPSVVLHRRDIPPMSADRVEKFDALCRELKAQGLDVDEDLKWYVLNRSAMTTMEMVIMTPEGKGYLFRVGDGQSVIANKKTGLVSPIGTRRKNADHSTAYIGVYHHLKSLEMIPFYFEKDDVVLTMTDGPGDTYDTPVALNQLGKLFLNEEPLKSRMLKFCREIGKKSDKKKDDYALVAMQMTSDA